MSFIDSELNVDLKWESSKCNIQFIAQMFPTIG